MNKTNPQIFPMRRASSVLLLKQKTGEQNILKKAPCNCTQKELTRRNTVKNRDNVDMSPPTIWKNFIS